MAFARPQHRAGDENAAQVKEDKAGKAAGQQGAGQRRALGDIGNLFNNNLNVGAARPGAKKDNKPAIQAEKPQATRAPGVLTRRAAAAQAAKDANAAPAQAQEPAQVPAARQRPATAKAPDAAPPAAKRQTSMSVLLARRSAEVEAGPASAETAEEPKALDIDAADRLDNRAASEYASHIFSYFHRVEPMFRVSPSYMGKQTDINEKMRAILVDWLVEVHFKFKLLPETLYLTCSIIDRFLEKKGVLRKRLQLVGITAMLIASKYEDVWAPEVRDFVYISDHAYTAEQILEMEKIMLNTLRFQLTVPTTYNFLTRYCKASGFSLAKKSNNVLEDKRALYTTYLVELSLVDYSCLKYSNSIVAAAAVFCASLALNDAPTFPQGLQKYSSFSEEALRPVALTLAALASKAPTSSLVSVYKKYNQSKYQEVAKTADLEELLQERMVA